MTKTKSRLRLVGNTVKAGQSDIVTVKPFINNDKFYPAMTMSASAMKVKICFVEHVNYHGEKAYGVYKAKIGCYMIFIDKHLKGHELRFLMGREVGYVVSCIDTFGTCCWKIPSHRRELENSAIKWANSIIEIFQKPKKSQQLIG